MKQKLYLHIGQGKTGTTAIQHFCELNKAVLKTKGIIYSPPRIYEHWPIREEPYEKALLSIDKHVGKKQDLLVSDETMCLKFAHSPEDLFLKERYPNLDIKIILYLRRQDLHLESFVNFLQAENYLQAPFEWIEYPSKFVAPYPGITPESYDYHSWITLLSQTYGKENVYIRVFEPQRFKDGDIFSDFLGVLGIEMSSEFKKIKGAANESLDHRFTELVNEQHLMFPDALYYERSIMTKAYIALNRSMGITKNRTLFSVDEREGILEYHSKGNASIARDFFGEEGPLFDQSIRDVEKDAFKEGELEKLPGLLNKIWFDAIADMDFGTFNTLKLRVYQDRYHAGDKSQLKKYRRHKLINSICKRFIKNFFKPLDFPFFDQTKK